MPPGVGEHIDQLHGLLGPGHRARGHGGRRAEHRRVQPVVVRVCLGVHDAGSGHVQGVDDVADDRGTSALAEVGHDAHEWLSHGREHTAQG